MTMSTTLRLRCLIEGDPNVFTVTAEGDDDVSALKVKIKEQTAITFERVEARCLDVWKVNIDIKAYLNDGRSLSHLKLEREGIESLVPWESISKYWSGQPPKGFVHIMVKRVPDVVTHSIEEDLDYLEKRHAISVQKGINAPSPSSGAKLPAFKHEQKTRPIMNGRPMENCELPVHLFHPAFSLFQRTLLDPHINLTANDYSRADKYMRLSAALYETEPLRHDAISTSLSEAVRFSLIPVVNTDGTKADGSIVATTQDNYPASAGIYELKNEIGAGGSDPAIQGSLSYRKTWVSKTLDPIRRTSCCPSFILSIAGPWMCIAGAIFIENVVVQKLTDYVWTGGNPYDDRELESVARLFKALSVGLQDLKTFYGNLSAAPGRHVEIERLFPFTRSYLDSQGQEVDFRYIRRLSMTKAVYLAATPNGRQLIVKFVQRYHSGAHRLLASHNLAPMLHYSSLDNAKSNTTGGPGVVVMDFVDGLDAYVLYSKTPLPDPIYDKVKQAISILHTESIVFGDLRLPNILITEKETPMLVDFDWCGQHGIDRYPPSLNDSSSIGWHEGAVRNGIMYMEHDTFMLEEMQLGHSMQWSP